MHIETVLFKTHTIFYLLSLHSKTATSNTPPGNISMVGNLTGDSATFMEEVETHITFKVAIYINYYWFPILAPIGLVGNTLSFLVMIRPNNRKVSTCIYMAAISINDNLMIFLALRTWLGLALKLYQPEVVHCKIVPWLTAMALQNSRYQVLAMTIDKYVAIKWPHRAATYSTPRRAKLIITGVFICTLIYNARHIPMSGLVRGRCMAYVVGRISVVLTWTNFIINGIIPFTMLICMNYVIVQTINKSGKMFGSTSKSEHISNKRKGMEARQRKMKSAENQLTVMLLLVTIMYLVLQIPPSIRNIYVKFIKQDTPAKYASTVLTLILSYSLFITNSGVNFFLYCISGNKFRNDLKEMLCCDGKMFSKTHESKSKQGFYSFGFTKYTEFSHSF